MVVIDSMNKWSMLLFSFMVILLSNCGVKNGLLLSSEENGLETKFMLWEDDTAHFVHWVPYDTPDTGSEPITQTLSIKFPDWDTVCAMGTLDVVADSNLVTLYYRVGVSGVPTNERTIITGTLQLLEGSTEHGKIKFNLLVNDLVRNEKVRYKGIREFRVPLKGINF